MMSHIKLKKMLKFLDDSVKEYVLANIKFNFLYVIIAYIVLFDVCTMISVRINATLGIVLIFLISFFMCLLLFSRRAAIGISDDGLLILNLKMFKVESKKVYKIPMDKIRSITVTKFGLGVNLKLSFISEDGVLERNKYKFSTFVIGSAERKKFAEDVYKKLVEIQKVIDKGDF